MHHHARGQGNMMIQFYAKEHCWCCWSTILTISFTTIQSKAGKCQVF